MLLEQSSPSGKQPQSGRQLPTVSPGSQVPSPQTGAQALQSAAPDLLDDWEDYYLKYDVITARVANQNEQGPGVAQVVVRAGSPEVATDIANAIATSYDDVRQSSAAEAIDEAVSSHLIEESDGLADSYQFSHAVVQQTLAGELTTSRKTRLHARIAEALEGIYAGDEEAHAAELAYHFGANPCRAVVKGGRVTRGGA